MNYSPVDFFEPDLTKYPDFSHVKGKMHVKVEAGDILYIPSFWWHGVKSSF
jgi:ribosomal protein L16 Arg81 hydroxylase